MQAVRSGFTAAVKSMRRHEKILVNPGGVNMFYFQGSVAKKAALLGSPARCPVQAGRSGWSEVDGSGEVDVQV